MEGQTPTFAVLPPQGGQQQQQQHYPPQQQQHQVSSRPVQQQQQQQPQQQHQATAARVTPPNSGQHKYSTAAWNLARKAHLDNQMLVTKTTDVETEDGRISNREAAEKIKDAWMYKQIRARRDEFTHYRQVRMRLILMSCASREVVLFLCVCLLAGYSLRHQKLRSLCVSLI